MPRHYLDSLFPGTRGDHRIYRHAHHPDSFLHQLPFESTPSAANRQHAARLRGNVRTNVRNRFWIGERIMRLVIILRPFSPSYLRIGVAQRTFPLTFLLDLQERLNLPAEFPFLRVRPTLVFLI